LNEIYQNLIADGINNVKIIAIGKSEWSSGNGNWTNPNTIPVVVDPPPNTAWSDWSVTLRDLFFLDTNGNYYTHYNITAESAVDQIQGTIDDMLEQYLNVDLYPQQVSLLDVFPNPFNPVATISFFLDHAGYSEISIFDINGRIVEIISSSYNISGNYQFNWNASSYSSGIYLVRLQTDSYANSKKIVLSK